MLWRWASRPGEEDQEGGGANGIWRNMSNREISAETN